MSCRTYDPCLDSKLNQIGSYASVARQSAQSATASAAAADSDATAAAASAAAAAASAEIAGIYLGPFATPPTVDNQGGPLQEGMLYYNTANNTLFVWNGSSWSAIQDDDIYLGGFAVAPTLNNQGLPLVNGNMYWNTVSSRLFTWNGSAWIQAFGQNYLGGFAVAPVLNNQSLPLVLGNLYWNSVTNNLWAYNGVAWIVTNFNETTPFLATGTTFARTLANRFADVVNVKDFGAIGDGVADDTTAIEAALFVISNGGFLSLNGGKYLITRNLFINATESITIANGALIYGGLPSNNLIRILPAKNLSIFNINIDGSNLVSKTIYVTPTGSESEIYFENVSCKNGLQTNIVTSFSAGIHCQANNSSVPVSKLKISNCNFENFTSTKIFTGALSSVGRGVYVQDVEDVQVCNCTFLNIGPYYDGDGFVVSATEEAKRSLFRACVTNSTFIDCAKRSIKSQISNTLVSNCISKRTQPFADGGGQADFDLQYGGQMVGVECRFGDGCAPVQFAAISANGTTKRNNITGSIIGLSVIADDPTDEIRNIVGIFRNDAGNEILEAELSLIKTNCNVRNIVYVYGQEGGTSATYNTNITLRDINVPGFTSATESAIAFLTRGSADIFNTNLELLNVNCGNSTPPAGYKSPLPGSTSFLRYFIKRSFAQTALDYEVDVSLGSTWTYSKRVAEDDTASLTFPFPSFYSALNIKIYYTSSRANVINKLYTEGILFGFATGVYYVETMAGVKTSAQTGAISITPNGSALDFTIDKTGGSTSATGLLTVTLTGSPHVLLPT